MNLSRYSLFASFCFALAITGALAGCAGNDSPAGPGSGKDSTVIPVATPPNAGSSFVLHYYEIGAGGTKVDSTEDIDTITVVGSGLAVAGKRDAVALRATDDTTTLYLHYDPNGDFSMLNVRNAHWPMIWETFPIATKGKLGLPTIREYDAGNKDTYVRNDSTYYEGTEDVTVGGKTYACHKIRNIQTHDTDGERTRARYTRYYWYAPAAKMFVKHEFLYEVFERSTGTVYFKRGPSYTYLISSALK